MPATITKHVNMRGKHFTIKRTTSFNVTLTEINYLPFLFVFFGREENRYSIHSCDNFIQNGQPPHVKVLFRSFSSVLPRWGGYLHIHTVHLNTCTPAPLSQVSPKLPLKKNVPMSFSKYIREYVHKMFVLVCDLKVKNACIFHGKTSLERWWMTIMAVQQNTRATRSTACLRWQSCSCCKPGVTMFAR